MGPAKRETVPARPARLLGLGFAGVGVEETSLALTRTRGRDGIRVCEYNFDFPRSEWCVPPGSSDIVLRTEASSQPVAAIPPLA